MNLERLVAGTLLGLATFWVGASFWLRGDGVPDWWLPVALGAGLGGAQALPDRAWPAHARTPAPPWARWSLLALVAIAFAAVAYGALATPSRHWDGAASFDAKVFWLTEEATLQQPFFAAEGVFHHSPDYPLLPALLVAMADRLAPGFGRGMLPLLYLVLCALVAAALHRRGVHPLLRLGATAAVALTPALLTSGGGAVDSGYAELPLLLATTTIAAGLLQRSALWFGLGIGLAVVTKPEGLFYGLGAAIVAFANGDRALLRSAWVAFALAAITWLPVRAELLHRDLDWLPLGVLAAFAAAAQLALRWTDGLARPVRTRWTIGLVVPMLALLALPLLADLVAADSALGVYLRQASNVWSGLANLPAYLGALVDHGVGRLRLGMALVVPPVAWLVARLRQKPLDDAPLAAFVLLGIATTPLPFVLSPEDDLQHHLRSSLPRLLLHWVGPAWLLSAAWIERLREADAPALRG
ncbi:MAG: hypothetical protein ACE37K_21280 [Planctomycetota bacterium]